MESNHKRIFLRKQTNANLVVRSTTVLTLRLKTCQALNREKRTTRYKVTNPKHRITGTLPSTANASKTQRGDKTLLSDLTAARLGQVPSLSQIVLRTGHIVSKERRATNTATCDSVSERLSINCQVPTVSPMASSKGSFESPSGLHLE